MSNTIKHILITAIDIGIKKREINFNTIYCNNYENLSEFFLIRNLVVQTEKSKWDLTTEQWNQVQVKTGK